MEIKADFEKTAVSYQQQMINKIWAQAGMKALAEIADIYPRMTSIHDSSLFDASFAMDFLNYGDKVIYCAMLTTNNGIVRSLMGCNTDIIYIRPINCFYMQHILNIT